jgi:hypothetical protein
MNKTNPCCGCTAHGVKASEGATLLYLPWFLGHFDVDRTNPSHGCTAQGAKANVGAALLYLPWYLRHFDMNKANCWSGRKAQRDKIMLPAFSPLVRRQCKCSFNENLPTRDLHYKHYGFII